MTTSVSSTTVERTATGAHCCKWFTAVMKRFESVANDGNSSKTARDSSTPSNENPSFDSRSRGICHSYCERLSENSLEHSERNDLYMRTTCSSNIRGKRPRKSTPTLERLKPQYMLVSSTLAIKDPSFNRGRDREIVATISLTRIFVQW